VNPPVLNSQVQFLGDGTQQPQQVADLIASFLAGAQQSLDIAIYDCALTGEPADTIKGAVQTAARRGVAVRVIYHGDTERTRGIAPPSGQTETFVTSLGVPDRASGNRQNLMHNKYVVRDAGTDAGAVLTGSTNWGEDAWSREENVILQLFGVELAAHFERDFEEIWSGDIATSGYDAGGPATLWYGGRPMPATVWFAPAEGIEMAHATADTIAQATERILIASPVITSGSILRELSTIVARGVVPVRGVVDRTQMDEVHQQWAGDPEAGWKIQAFETIARGARLAGKVSTPWSPGAVHNYMHLKMIVVDDSVLTRSFNFSHSGENNAENLLRLDSAPFADVCADFIQSLIARYAGTPASDAVQAPDQ